MSKSQNPAVSEVHTPVKTILVVEDDRSIGEFFVEAIKQETPYQAIHAIDADEALEILHSLKPDLMLLDYSLPRMNGLELYDKLQTINEFQHIPVLLISAHLPLKEVKKRKLPSLNKPVELEKLLETITTLIT